VGFRSGLRRGLVGAGLLQPGGAWSIALYGGPDPRVLSPIHGLPLPILGAADVRDVRAAFVADPFMLRRRDGWHMFFEVMNADLGRGQIGYAWSADLFDWRYQGLALALPYHLSYPFVFSHAGETYMVPETSADGSVHLFRARAFPDNWELDSTLLRGHPFVDATLHHHGGHWYLFTDTDQRARHTTLRLYHSLDLRGPWSEHPASPLYTHAEVRARPAGRVVVLGDTILRFAQNCVPRYGSGIDAIVIDTLTPSEYHERTDDATHVLGAAGSGWNGLGMHHIDLHHIQGGWVACVDGRAARRLSLPAPRRSLRGRR
jgi:hypothetical protein